MSKKETETNAPKPPKAVADVERLKVPWGTWFECDVKLWQCKCYLFVGPLDLMKESLCRSRKKAKDAPVEGALYSPRPEMSKEALDFAMRWTENHLNLRTDGDAFGDGAHVFMRLSKLCVGELTDMAILMHECLHAAAGILGEIGVRETGGEEALAYTQEFLFKDFMEQALVARGIKPTRVK